MLYLFLCVFGGENFIYGGKIDVKLCLFANMIFWQKNKELYIVFVSLVYFARLGQLG